MLQPDDNRQAQSPSPLISMSLKPSHFSSALVRATHTFSLTVHYLGIRYDLRPFLYPMFSWPYAKMEAAVLAWEARAGKKVVKAD